MKDILILLRLLKKLEEIELSMKKSNMIEHTFILSNDNKIEKTQKIALPKEVSDKAIREVMKWQMKSQKQN